MNPPFEPRVEVGRCLIELEDIDVRQEGRDGDASTLPAGLADAVVAEFHVEAIRYVGRGLPNLCRPAD